MYNIGAQNGPRRQDCENANYFWQIFIQDYGEKYVKIVITLVFYVLYLLEMRIWKEAGFQEKGK